MNRPEKCKGCPLYHEMLDQYVPPQIAPGAKILIVGEAPGETEGREGVPFIGDSGQWLNNMLERHGINRKIVSVVNTICCRPPDNIYPGSQKWPGDNDIAKAGIDYCVKQHLQPLLEQPWQKIISLGGEALKVLTGKEGILFWRGSPLPLKGQKVPLVMPTLHPAYLMRYGNLISVVIRDIGKGVSIPPEDYQLFANAGELDNWELKQFAFDLEWDMWTGQITLCGITDRYYHAKVFDWNLSIGKLKAKFENAEELIGHNIIGADLKHIARLGWKIKARVMDTMLMQHLVQPDMPHDLRFVASCFTNKVAWKGKGGKSSGDDIGNVQWKTWDSPDALPREAGGYGGCTSGDEAFRLYNARDVDGEFQISFPLWGLIKKYGLERVYWYVSVPMGYICRELGDRGLKVNHGKLKEVRRDIEKEINELDAKLPDGLRSFTREVACNVPAPPGSYKVKVVKCKGCKEEIAFVKPGEKLCECGKLAASGKMKEMKIIKGVREETVVPWRSAMMVAEYAKNNGCEEVRDRKTDRPTTGEKARKVWGRKLVEFSVVNRIKELNTLYTNFAKEGLLKTDRMFFNLLVHGTNEGRLSSSGQREGVDLNIQNLPEEIKKIFVPDYPGWGFLDFDISQGENLLRCWFAKDWVRMGRILDGSLDEHSEVASLFFEIEVTKTNENKHLRKAGKIINHARGYGGGIRAIKENLILEGFPVTDAMVKAKLQELRNADPITTEWQDRTLALVRQQGWLENPFGRRRWFQMRDVGPKALAFLPASTLADCVLRMMIGMHLDCEWDSTRIIDVIEELGLARCGNFTGGWKMVTQVHDSIVAQGPWENVQRNAEMMQAVMTQPWKELDGFSFNVEPKGGTISLGECEKLKIG